jgi:pimeloyl-ACP methyl ester carboxylesterase
MHHQLQLNDTTLFVETAGKGTPLLLVHGFPLDHQMWSAQFDYFSTKHQVIALDLRGFGRSGKVTSHQLTMRQLADDCAAVLEKLQINQQVIFCGLSMGGYVAWEFFKRHRDKLDRLILCDTKAIADDVETARGRNLMAEHVLSQGLTALAESMLPRLLGPTASAELQQQLRDKILDNDPRSIAAAMRGLAIRDDHTPLLNKIDLSTLVICGEQDVISTPEEMRAFAAKIPQATFAAIAGSGHMAPMENPAEFNRELATFID